eukprot:SAG22_NODE_404_length_11005_cov_8.751788_14_plen_61_part_00
MWFCCHSGGLFPRRRLLVVTATYRPPSAGLMRVGDTGGKLCAAALVRDIYLQQLQATHCY